MSSPFWVMALSRLDGSKADGIHLLWTAPYPSGYSVNGYDIQRRLSYRKPEITCYTLTPSDLLTLQQQLRVETPVAQVGLRRAPCPEFPHHLPDEPHHTDEPPTRECIDFRAFRTGSSPNPRTEQGVTFEVRDHTGAPMAQTEVIIAGGFTGLNCGFQLDLKLPSSSPWVELSVVHFAQPAKIEAFNIDGTSAGTTTMTVPPRQTETLKLTGTAINRIVVHAPNNETLLLELCFGRQEQECIDFRAFQNGSGPNPRTEQGATFEARNHAGVPMVQTEIRTWGNFTGLNCGFQLEVKLQFSSPWVELSLVHFAQPAKIEAFNTDGTSAGIVTMSIPPSQAQTLRITGKAIDRIIVNALHNETLLLELCFSPLTASRDQQMHDAGQPSRFPTPQASLSAGRAFTLFTATPGVATHMSHDERTCLVYDLKLRATHTVVRTTITVPAVLAIALREGKAVDTRLVSDIGGMQVVLFENRAVDRVLLYVERVASSMIICVDIPLSPEKEEKEWAKVPYIAKGIQLPIRAVNTALSSDSDEKNLASSRLLSNESFDSSAFRDVANVMNEAASHAKFTSPMWYTTLTRERVEDQFIELRSWPYALSLLVDAAWRRMLGFGYFDDGHGLTLGALYDYRVTGYFRRRNIEEQLYGFHTIPSGTTLPSSFHLGPLLFNTFFPSRVEIFPAVPGTSLRSTGRKGIALKTTGFASQSLIITFPTPVLRAVLELEPGANQSLAYEAETSSYVTGLSGSLFTGNMPNQQQVVINFPEPIDTLTLKGQGFLYGLRIATSPVGADPEEVVPQSVTLYGVRYESTPAPASPPFLGTLNLQEPIVAADPAVTTQHPPNAIGFRLLWVPPPIPGSSSPVLWPPDLDVFPPFDVLGFQLERRRVDTGGPFTEIDQRQPPTLFFGNRGSRRDLPQLQFGIDLLDVFPEVTKPTPPVSVFMETEDVLLSAAKSEAPPGSLHQYRIFSVDAIGRRSAVATVGSIVRLEKHTPPPQPVSPTTLPPPGGTLPSGVRARVLQASDSQLSPQDRKLLRKSTNAVVLEWGWTDQERTRDPFAKEFRIYWQPTPPDTVHGTVVGSASLVNGLYEMIANLDQPVSTDAMKGRYIRAGSYPFKVASHTAGSSITIRLEPSQLAASTVPLAASFEFHPILRGAELRPSAWPERAHVVPITTAENYQYIFRNRLLLDANHPLGHIWVGVSAADDQGYIADELPASQHHGGRPGNESSIAVASAQAHYIGRPIFSVPPPLPDVPEQVTDEPTSENVSVLLDLSTLLPGVVIPVGHKITLERLAVDDLVALVGVGPNDSIGMTFPDDTTDSYVLPNSSNQATFLSEIRTSTSARVEGKFLMDLLIRYLSRLENLWQPASPVPLAFGTVGDTLPNKAARYIHRIRLVDARGHISEGGAIVPQFVRVPSLRAPLAPQFDLPNSDNNVLTVAARLHDAFDLKWLLLFMLTNDVANPFSESILEKPQMLRLPNRRDLYPDDGIRLRLRDGTLLAPTAVDVATGMLHVPDRLLSVSLTPGLDKRVAVWAVAMTRDGIPSRFSGPRIAVTGPAALIVPTLTITAATGEDHATWTSLSIPAQVALECSIDGGTSWSRVSPWLPETQTSHTIPVLTTGVRQYRLALRGSGNRSAIGPAVSPT